jgi:transcription factor WhiB
MRIRFRGGEALRRSAQTPCLAWAPDQEVTDGVWGGTIEDERRAIPYAGQAFTADPVVAPGRA